MFGWVVFLIVVRQYHPVSDTAGPSLVSVEPGRADGSRLGLVIASRPVKGSGEPAGVGSPVRSSGEPSPVSPEAVSVLPGAAVWPVGAVPPPQYWRRGPAADQFST